MGALITFPRERAQYKGAKREYTVPATVTTIGEWWQVDGIMEDGTLHHGRVRAINYAQAVMRAALTFPWYDTAFIVGEPARVRDGQNARS